jgi:hypothetical protein
VSRGEGAGEVFGVDRVDAWLGAGGCRRVCATPQLVGGQGAHAQQHRPFPHQNNTYSLPFFLEAPGRLW